MIAYEKLVMILDKAITVRGKIFHNDRRKRIDLKKPICDLFENTENEIGYIMELCMSKEKLDQRITELAKKKVMPLLLYFVEGDDNDEMS